MTATVGLPVERVELRQPALSSAPIRLPTANLGRQPANYALPPGRLQTPDIPIGIKPIKNIHNVLPANEKAERIPQPTPPLQVLGPAHEYDFENSRIIRTPSRAVYIQPVKDKQHIPLKLLIKAPIQVPTQAPTQAPTQVPAHPPARPPPKPPARPPPPIPPAPAPPHIPPPVQAHGTAPAQAPVRTTQTIETQTQTAPYGFTIIDEKGKKILKPISQSMVQELTHRRTVRFNKSLPPDRYKRKPYYVRSR
jgi:hypothetical protein